MDINEYLAHIVHNGSSDLHLSAGVFPMMRVDGEMMVLEQDILSNEKMEEILKQVLPEEKQKKFRETKECDTSYEIDGLARFRVNAFYQSRGLGFVFRVIPSNVPSIDELGFSDLFKKLSLLESGLVLMTGPTGSGKSTSLAAMVNHINENTQKHVITIEDPIEFVHQSQKSLINQREVGESTLSFNDALRASLREDPDVILIGEMRDLETVRLALRAAETGHLVLSTLHTSSAPRTINRIIDIFPGDEKSMIRSMLSESLKASISQRLFKKKTGGRAAAHEILVSTPAVGNLIREDKIPQLYSVMQTGRQMGMITMQQAVDDLVQKGVIDSQSVPKEGTKPE